MDPYRARSTARYGGLLMLVFFGFVFLWMHKSLVSLKAGVARAAPTSSAFLLTVPSADPTDAAHLLLGPAGRVYLQGDLDLDGSFESLVALPIGPEGKLERSSRLAVVAPRPGGRFEVLLDTGRSTDLPAQGTAVSSWKVATLQLDWIVLEGLAADGHPLGRRVSFRWNRPGHGFVRQEGAEAAAPPPGS